MPISRVEVQASSRTATADVSVETRTPGGKINGLWKGEFYQNLGDEKTLHVHNIMVPQACNDDLFTEVNVKNADSGGVHFSVLNDTNPMKIWVFCRSKNGLCVHFHVTLA